MKKRVLDRVRDKYLYKKLPENLVPGKVLKKSNKQARGGNQMSVPLPRSTGLSIQFRRGAKGISHRKVAEKFTSSMEIDALERGSLASLFVSPKTSAGGENLSITPLQDGIPTPSDAPERPVSPLIGSSLVTIRRHGEELPKSTTSSRLKAPVVKQGFHDPLLNDQGRYRASPLPKGRGGSLFSWFQLSSGLSRQEEKRPSPLLLQIMERNKLRILYGNLSNRELDRLVRRAGRSRGGVGDNLFRLLESRLDVVLWRIGFLPTIPFARQWIYHGKVVVNNKVITLSNYTLQPGDGISISPSHHQFLKNHINRRIRTLSKGRWRDTEYTTRTHHPSFGLSSIRHRKGRHGEAEWNALPWSPSSTLSSTIGYQSERAVLRTPSTTHQRQDVERRNDILWAPTNGGNLEKMVRNSVGTHHYQDSRKESLPPTWETGQKRDRLRFFSLKATHVEVSFRVFAAIYLYPPQRILVPAIVDVEKIQNS